jgi:CTP:molybdopterin cytidylyltransferase MocA
LNTSSIGIIVLAAGSSSRMGEPKQLLHFEGETLLRRAVEAALETACRPVIVVMGAVVTEKMREEVSSLEALIVVNELWTEGMGSSIRCGIGALEAATFRRNAGGDSDALRSAIRYIESHQSPYRKTPHLGCRNYRVRVRGKRE